MNIAKNTKDIPINGIFANKSMRAMTPTSIDRMTVVLVNTFPRCDGGEMELRAARAGVIQSSNRSATALTAALDQTYLDFQIILGMLEEKPDAPTWWRWSARAPGSKRARSSNDPTNQQVTSKSRDTPIHR
jgi:hypothetical protein